MRFQILAAAIALLCVGCGPDQESEKPDQLAAPDQSQAVDAPKSYAVTPNTGRFPFPTKLPVVAPEHHEDFDWERYVQEARSDADRAFRAHLSTPELQYSIDGGTHSAKDEAIRYRLAGDEFKAKCDDLLRRYRAKLESDPENLAALNEYAAHRDDAMSLQVELVGGSWLGGSGIRVAYPQARMHAYINYFHDLDALGASLHLQDLPR